MDALSAWRSFVVLGGAAKTGRKTKPPIPAHRPRGADQTLNQRHLQGPPYGLGVTADGLLCNPDQQRELGYWPEPWAEMPPGGLPFDEFASITTPAANSTETLVLSFGIPNGFDGIILGVTNIFTGPGFVEGSGDLTWRIRTGEPNLQGTPVRNYSRIRNTLGDLGDARTVHGGILVTSGQFVQYSVTHVVGSPIVPAGTRIICNVTGFYWPRGSSPMAKGGR